MAARTDIHKPSAIVPADYTFVAITTAASARLNFVPQVRAMNAAVEQHMARTGGAYATHEHKGNCQSCGAHCVYMAVFHHAKSNEYLRVGLDCAEKLGVGDVNRFRTFMKIVDAAKHHRAGRRKAQGLLHLRGLDKAWDTWLLVTDLPRALQTAQMQHNGQPFALDTPVPVLADFAEEYEVPVALVLRALAKQERTREIGTVCDIVSRVVKYGNLSDNQARYLATLLDTIEGKVQTPTPAKSSKVPDRLPDGATNRYTVQGRSGERSIETTLTDMGAIRILRKVSGDEFVTSLLRQFDAGDTRYGSPLSPRQWNWVMVLAAEAEQRAEEDKAREASAVQVATAGEMQGIHDLFRAAEQHLKRARIRLAVPYAANSNGYRVYTLFPMRRAGFVGVAGADPETGRGMVGEITPQGVFSPRYAGDHDTLRNALGAFAKDPVTGAKESARLCGQCCFCGLTLTDERSTEVGYGPICAQHFHLPWGDKPTPKAPVCSAPKAQPAPSAPQVTKAPEVKALPEPVGTTVLLNTDQFQYASKLFTAEASDLVWSSKWPDTIKLTSSKTGITKTFVLKGFLRDQEGDLQCGDYTEQGGDLAIRVFND